MLKMIDTWCEKALASSAPLRASAVALDTSVRTTTALGNKFKAWSEMTDASSATTRASSEIIDGRAGRSETSAAQLVA
jgi:hypothetical protein